jgi:AraC-like DNA-binding protein
MARKPKPRWRNIPGNYEPTPLPDWHGLLAPVVTRLLAEIGVGVSVWVGEDYWHPIHTIEDVVGFENSHVIQQRWAYNRRSFATVGRTRETLMGEHLGFHDLFVPIVSGDVLRGVIVAGPIATTRPTSGELRERWYALTQSQARITDPVFLQYLERTQLALVLDAEQLSAFRGLLASFAAMLVGVGDTRGLAKRADTQQRIVRKARFDDQMWRTARTLIEPRTTPDWAVHQAGEMTTLGLDRFPQHAVVSLLSPRTEPDDALEDILERDRFQRACVELARKRRNVVCGQLGDRGVFFLVNASGSAARVDALLADLAARASAVARRFGFRLHSGLGRGARDASLYSSYEGALLSAERALSEGERVAQGSVPSGGLGQRLRELRLELGSPAVDKPELVLASFDRYVEAVLAHSGYRMDLAGLELGSGLERLTEALAKGGFVDAVTLRAWFSTLDRSVKSAKSTRDVAAAFRRVVSDAAQALKNPTQARQSGNVARGASFMREHFAEHVALTHVARAAGLAPTHFWRLFKREYGMSFADYLKQLRLDEARQLLKTSTLGIDQVQKLSGFQSRASFFRVFRSAVGMTPEEYRDSLN